MTCVIAAVALQIVSFVNDDTVFNCQIAQYTATLIPYCRGGALLSCSLASVVSHLRALLCRDHAMKYYIP